MSEEKFDAIVVGGGLAGSTAAYLMAKEGLNVLLCERGNFGGSKNMTGGRIYSHSIEKIFPNFADEAPVERKVTKERISMTTENDSFSMEFRSPRLGEKGKDSYVVKRSEFDRWLFEKAEEAGAIAAPGIKVDELIVENGHVTGVICAGEEMKADVVIIAEGANSVLAEKAGLKKMAKPNQIAVSVKEVYELPESTIQDRFGLTDDEGAAYLYAGSPTQGAVGGGFIYTNKDSLSVGLVLGLGHIEDSKKTIEELFVSFCEHPDVAPLIKGGKLVERSGHVVPEAGLGVVPKLCGDGYLITGDAAGFCLNIGYVVRGMDMAITSGELAAKAVIAAKAKNDFSESGLSVYKNLIDDSYVMKDLKLYSKLPEFMENPRIFKDYPQLITEIMADMFIIDGEPAVPIRKKIMGHVKKVGIMNLVKDGMKGGKAL